MLCSQLSCLFLGSIVIVPFLVGYIQILSVVSGVPAQRFGGENGPSVLYHQSYFLARASASVRPISSPVRRPAGAT